MEESAFWTLYDIISPNMTLGNKKRKRGATPNGDISKDTRLAMALRYFAGGDPYDIGQSHGVHSYEVKSSVWDVVDAVHATASLNIHFPEDHQQQLEIAEGFKRKSVIDLDNCVGAIDGILVWIHKPSKKDMKDNGFGEMKCFCGRKKKYGLNMQGTCDSRGRFLDVEIGFPGASSDFFAFTHSKLREKVGAPGFLYPGLCLFGDNAYVNTRYMITPWRGVSGGAKDAFNFFHSSLRINVECCFGMLIHRFGILRKPIPMNITIKKTTALTLALCKLHNFCITQADQIAQPYERDIANISNRGGIDLPMIDDNETWRYDHVGGCDRLNSLLDGGQHMEDHSREDRRVCRYTEHLPADVMLAKIEEHGYQRPI
jgi:hypothetical protein